MTEQTKGVDVRGTLYEAVERASNAMGLTDDAMQFESDGDDALVAVEELVAAARLLWVLSTSHPDDTPDWPEGWTWSRIESALTNFGGMP